MKDAWQEILDLLRDSQIPTTPTLVETCVLAAAIVAAGREIAKALSDGD